MIFNVISLFLISILTSAHSWKFFHNGRSKGGNLGALQSDVESDKNFTRWFTQKLDHYDVTNLDTWQQRYYVNEEFWNVDKFDIVFLMIGGEGEATDSWMTNGAWVDYAKQYKALLFQLEHRFYGKSHPTTDLSVENLKYLTSEQALADLATFVTAMNEEYKFPQEVKWIAFGGSYPGSLAAWARLKYPHLIHAAVSTSGPLLAIPDFQDYFQVVADDLYTINPDCYATVKNGTAQIDVLLQHKSGRQTLSDIFSLCDSLEESADNDDDIANLYTNLAGNFAGIAQYNKDNRISTNGTKLGNITLDTVCNIMTDDSISTEIERLAKFNSLILDATNETCLEFKYSKMIDDYKNTSWDAPQAEGGRQWLFQTCNEFGFYQTSSKKPQIFGTKFPLEFSIQQCVEIFGIEFNGTYVDDATDRTNTFYGALDIEVSNVVFVHGSVDPWHALGITQALNDNAPAIFIKGTAHCANMYPPADTDLPQLQAARKQIQELIGIWLQ